MDVKKKKKKKQSARCVKTELLQVLSWLFLWAKDYTSL